jgi:hypothetical protein
MTKTVNGIEINQDKVNLLLKWIDEIEKKNLASREKNDTEMARDITKRIEEEVQCL